ncbi:hypothetical protein CIPAW_14G040600 [Carya illinoinensis]|uniref:No apical meristem-associated C-terminal domain-containing protein n=1 Tax=Carya illinoinensis TaxID=32201 RepID=A0A8T1NAS6_CARIL|nr:hypothetical protein CIPAW_14G040600 [Carya illinoinensis]
MIFLMSATNEQELSPPEIEVIEIEPSGRKTQRGNNFSNDKDLLLVEGCLETSLDAVQGKDQKHIMLWKIIHKYFEENNKFDFLRNYTSLMNRWSTIQQATNKFCDYLAQVEGMHPSGFNEQDKIGKAKVMFLELEKKSFNFDNFWRVLRFHPKWVEHMDMVKPKTKPSRKAEKEKRKRKEMTNSDSLVVLNEMAEIRKSILVLMQEARDHDNKMLCLRQEEVSLRQDELLIQKEKVLLQQVKARLEEMKEYERIITLNTSAMPPMLQ